MTKLNEVRASIISQVSEFVPTTDFQIPDALIDFWIFQECAAVKREEGRIRRGTEFVNPGEITRFECQTVKLSESECIEGTACNSQYVLDLTAFPQDLDSDLGLVGAYIQKNMVRLKYYSYNDLLGIEYSDTKPSYSRPGYSRIGNRLYFFGGDRDFTKCPVLLDMVVGGLSENGTDSNMNCPGDIKVPIQQYLLSKVEEIIVKRILQETKIEEEDKVKDGLQKQNDQ